MNEIIKDTKGNVIEIKLSWCADDVLQVARDHAIKLTKNQASNVLSLIYHKHDANIGVNWEVILYTIDRVLVEDVIDVSLDINRQTKVKVNNV